MKLWLSVFLIFQFFTLNNAYSQQPEDIVQKTQDDILLVGVAGAGGAVLGLSTLSFYDKPSTHLSNIWTGAAIGVIVGVIWVAYNSAQQGSEELIGFHSSEGFSTLERSYWHNENSEFLTMNSVQFGTQFWQSSF